MARVYTFPSVLEVSHWEDSEHRPSCSPQLNQLLQIKQLDVSVEEISMSTRQRFRKDGGLRSLTPNWWSHETTCHAQGYVIDFYVNRSITETLHFLATALPLGPINNAMHNTVKSTFIFLKNFFALRCCFNSGERTYSDWPQKTEPEGDCFWETKLR